MEREKMISTSTFNSRQISSDTFLVLKGLRGILPTSKGENKAFPSLFPLPFKVPCIGKTSNTNIFEWSPGGVWIVLFSEVMVL